MSRKIGFETIRFFLILLFVYTALSKLLTYSKFVIQVQMSPVLPSNIYLVAWVVPIVELTIALLLLFPSFERRALYASAVLMVFFTFYVVAILTVADYVPCSCGGIVEILSWRGHLVFNIFFIFLTVGGIVLQRLESSKKTIDQKTLLISKQGND